VVFNFDGRVIWHSGWKLAQATGEGKQVTLSAEVYIEVRNPLMRMEMSKL